MNEKYTENKGCAGLLRNPAHPLFSGFFHRWCVSRIQLKSRPDIERLFLCGPGRTQTPGLAVISITLAKTFRGWAVQSNETNIPPLLQEKEPYHYPTTNAAA